MNKANPLDEILDAAWDRGDWAYFLRVAKQKLLDMKANYSEVNEESRKEFFKAVKRLPEMKRELRMRQRTENNAPNE